MHLYSTAYLAFAVRIPRDLEGSLESPRIHYFNKTTGAGLGYLTAVSFTNDELYLTAYCETAEPDEWKPVAPRDFSRKDRIAWKRQLEKFLREHGITPLDQPSLRLIADLDN